MHHTAIASTSPELHLIRDLRQMHGATNANPLHPPYIQRGLSETGISHAAARYAARNRAYSPSIALHAIPRSLTH